MFQRGISPRVSRSAPDLNKKVEDSQKKKMIADVQKAPEKEKFPDCKTIPLCI